MLKKFGKKITLMGLLAACILMASASSAFAVIQEYNGLPVIGYHVITGDPAPDAQYVIAQNNYDVAAVEVLVQDTGPCVGGLINVTMNVHAGNIMGPVIGVQNVFVPRCFAGPIRFNFPAVGPMLNAGNLYTLDLNTLTPGTELSWAYTNNAVAPGVGLSLWNGAPNFANDYRFAIFN